MEEPLDEKEWLNEAEVARMLGRTRDVVRHWRRSGFGPRFEKLMPSRRVRYARAEVERWRDDESLRRAWVPEPDEGRPGEAKDLLWGRHAANFLGCSLATLQSWRLKGTGPAWVRIGVRVYYRREDLKAWLDAGWRPVPDRARRTWLRPKIAASDALRSLAEGVMASPEDAVRRSRIMLYAALQHAPGARGRMRFPLDKAWLLETVKGWTREERQGIYRWAEDISAEARGSVEEAKAFLNWKLLLAATLFEVRCEELRCGIVAAEATRDIEDALERMEGQEAEMKRMGWNTA